MAILHVKSTGSATAPYETWAKAATNLETAYEAAGDGDTVYVHYTHDDSSGVSAARTYTQTAGNRIVVMSVDAASETDGSTCTYTPGAIIGSTPGTGNYKNTWTGGNTTFLGIIYKTDAIDSLGSSAFFTFDNCTLEWEGYVTFDGAPSCMVARNCVFKQHANGSNNWMFQLNAHNNQLIIEGMTLDITDQAPSYCVRPQYGAADNFISIRNCDFSNAQSGFFLIEVSAAGDTYGTQFQMEGVLMPSTYSVLDGTTAYSHPAFRSQAWSVGTALQNVSYSTTYGTAVESTSVYRTAGAEYDQSSSRYSIKITGTTTSTYSEAFRMPIFPRWCDANPTLRVELFYDSATSLTDANCWIEVERPNATSPVLREIISTRATPNAAGSSLTTSALSASDWTGESGSNQKFQKIEVAVTGGAAGMHRVWLCYAPAATTPVLYVCPRVEVS